MLDQLAASIPDQAAARYRSSALAWGLGRCAGQGPAHRAGQRARRPPHAGCGACTSPERTTEGGGHSSQASPGRAAGGGGRRSLGVMRDTSRDARRLPRSSSSTNPGKPKLGRS